MSSLPDGSSGARQCLSIAGSKWTHCVTGERLLDWSWGASNQPFSDARTLLPIPELLCSRTGNASSMEATEIDGVAVTGDQRRRGDVPTGKAPSSECCFEVFLATSWQPGAADLARRGLSATAKQPRRNVGLPALRLRSCCFIPLPGGCRFVANRNGMGLPGENHDRHASASRAISRHRVRVP